MRQFFRKVTKAELKVIGIFMIATVCSVLTGFAAGFSYGTGDSAITLFIPAKSVAPPAEISTTKLDNVTSVLVEQPKQVYREGYNCMDYAWDAMRALQWEGQPSAIVRLGFTGGLGHVVILVPTEDKGYQFIEPQNGEVIHPDLGGIYQGKMITNMTILEFTWVPFDIFLLDPEYGLRGWDDPK